MFNPYLLKYKSYNINYSYHNLNVAMINKFKVFIKDKFYKIIKSLNL